MFQGYHEEPRKRDDQNSSESNQRKGIPDQEYGGQKNVCNGVWSEGRGTTLQAREREKQERKAAVRVMKEVEQEDRSFVEETEEVTRIGRYAEGGSRPLRVKFQSQSAAEDVLSRVQRLARREGFKNVWIKKDYSMEEREKIREMWREADEKTGTEWSQRRSTSGKW